MNPCYKGFGALHVDLKMVDCPDRIGDPGIYVGLGEP